MGLPLICAWGGQSMAASHRGPGPGPTISATQSAANQPRLLVLHRRWILVSQEPALAAGKRVNMVAPSFCRSTAGARPPAWHLASGPQAPFLRLQRWCCRPWAHLVCTLASPGLLTFQRCSREGRSRRRRRPCPQAQSLRTCQGSRGPVWKPRSLRQGHKTKRSRPSNHKVSCCWREPATWQHAGVLQLKPLPVARIQIGFRVWDCLQGITVEQCSDSDSWRGVWTWPSLHCWS